MRRFLAWLIMFAVVVSNGAGVATAMCLHSDAAAHVAALESSDRDTAELAANEEATAQSMKKQARSGDSSASSFVGLILPPPPIELGQPVIEAVNSTAWSEAALDGRALQPLLEPPLA